MGVVVKLGHERWRLYLKGTGEIMTKKCTRLGHVVVGRDPDGHGGCDNEVETTEIDGLASDSISRAVMLLGLGYLAFDEMDSSSR